MMGMTHKQQDLFRFLKERISNQGVPPTFNEMRVHLGVSSKSGIHRLITGLEQRGAIRRLRGRARAIEIVETCTVCRHCGGDL